MLIGFDAILAAQQLVFTLGKRGRLFITFSLFLYRFFVLVRLLYIYKLSEL